MAKRQKTGGRRKGTPNKRTAEQRAEVGVIARHLVDDPAYRATVADRMIKGTAGSLEVLLWHYAYGKPVEMVIGPGPDGEHTVVKTIVHRHLAE